MSPPGRRLWVPLALLGLAVAVYADACRFPLVAYDDPQYVSANPDLAADRPAAAVRYAFTTVTGGNWHPLVWASFFADRWAWRLRPGPMHAENVALHAAAGVALWWAVADLTGRPGRAAVVAALFICHPMHVESVAWVSERKDVLSTLPLFAAIGAYARYARAGPRLAGEPGRGGHGEQARRLNGPRWYAATLVLYALSLSAKATGVSLPVLLLVLDAWPLRRCPARHWAGLVVEKLPLAALAGAASVATVLAQGRIGATTSTVALGLGDRAANAVVCYALYAAKLAWPAGLAVYYPHPGSRPAAAVAAAAGLLGLVTTVAVRQRRRRPYLLVGWLWFGVTLVPTIGLVQVGSQAMADRYSYLPSVGLSVAVVWAAADVLGTLGPAAAVVVIAALSLVARRQVDTWRDTRTLFARDEAVVGPNAVADDMLGGVAFDAGDYAAAAARYGRAAAEQPNDPRPLANLARADARLGDVAGAERATAAAVRLAPSVGAYRVDHAAALAALPGRRAEAVAECRAALALDPSDARARAGLAALGAP